MWQWWSERNRVREGERSVADDLAFISGPNAHEYLTISAQEKVGGARERNIGADL